MAGNHSIADLRIYQQALVLEEKVYSLAKKLPPEQFELANNLRRASAAVAHHIYEAYRSRGYNRKIDHLHAARTEAESAAALLDSYEKAGGRSTAKLREDCAALIKQSWGLIKYFKQRQERLLIQGEIIAKDELASARR